MTVLDMMKELAKYDGDRQVMIELNSGEHYSPRPSETPATIVEIGDTLYIEPE